MSAFCIAFRMAMAIWMALRSGSDPTQLMVPLESAINTQLAGSGVPPITFSAEQLSDGTRGTFDQATWTFTIDTDVLAAPDASLAGTIYHEARHAEQFYAIARWLAGIGMSASDISETMGIPLYIAEAAVADPARRGTIGAVYGAAMYDSLYGSRSRHREQVYGDRDNPSFYSMYRALPEEADAWAVRDLFMAVCP